MPRRKKTPEVSTITRPTTVAYARKQKTGGGDDVDDEDEAAPPTDAAVVKAALATMKGDERSSPPERPTVPFDPSMVREIAGEPEVARARVETVGMSAFGAPPEIPEPTTIASYVSACTLISS